MDCKVCMTSKVGAILSQSLGANEDSARKRADTLDERGIPRPSAYVRWESVLLLQPLASVLS